MIRSFAHKETERFWINLQTRYDLEVEKDRLKNRLDQEVHIRATTQAE